MLAIKLYGVFDLNASKLLLIRVLVIVTRYDLITKINSEILNVAAVPFI